MTAAFEVMTRKLNPLQKQIMQLALIHFQMFDQKNYIQFQCIVFSSVNGEMSSIITS